jgi:putative ABC transport system ATP-binding protein
MRSPAPTTPTEPAVRVRGLRKVHGCGDAAVRALDGVDVDFAATAFTAIMGPSGSGKSTLLHCAAGLDDPDAGDVRLAGTDLAGLDETARTLLRRDRVGFVFQSFNLVESLTVAMNVALPLVLGGRRPRAGEVDAALAAVGLAGTGGRRPAELSGGQQQRVAIARALVVAPAVVFADEPTGALDSTTGREVLAMLRDLVDTAGRTVVMVTHDPAAAAWGDRVVFLYDGRVAGELTAPTVETVTARLSALESAP